MAITGGQDDPFRDPARTAEGGRGEADGLAASASDTLAVGRDASLTLGTDSLVVLGARDLPLLTTGC
jgi:sphingosine kinase